MSRGADARTIARELGISVHTCRGYVKSVLAKLGAHSQLEAVMVAIRLGLLSPAQLS
jgi:DNA-binding CsgD family transcriptional regulator